VKGVFDASHYRDKYYFIDSENFAKNTFDYVRKETFLLTESWDND